jgi:hypothetical protein
MPGLIFPTIKFFAPQVFWASANPELPGPKVCQGITGPTPRSTPSPQAAAKRNQDPKNVQLSIPEIIFIEAKRPIPDQNPLERFKTGRCSPLSFLAMFASNLVNFYLIATRVTLPPYRVNNLFNFAGANTMKTNNLIFGLTLSLLASSAFALPTSNTQSAAGTVVAEGGSSHTNASHTGSYRQASDGADHIGANRLAADGADRVGNNRQAADGSDHVGANRLAADGADRVGNNRQAADGSDHVGANRLAADGADRVGNNRQAADGSDHVGANRLAADGADRVGNNRVS